MAKLTEVMFGVNCTSVSGPSAKCQRIQGKFGDGWVAYGDGSTVSVTCEVPVTATLKYPWLFVWRHEGSLRNHTPGDQYQFESVTAILAFAGVPVVVGELEGVPVGVGVMVAVVEDERVLVGVDVKVAVVVEEIVPVGDGVRVVVAPDNSVLVGVGVMVAVVEDERVPVGVDDAIVAVGVGEPVPVDVGV